MKNKNSAIYFILNVFFFAIALQHAALADVSLEFVAVVDPGNAGDVQFQGTFGAVDHSFRIMKHEVSNTQYTAFLNSTAVSDPNGLYNSSMGSDARGGINRSGSAGSFTYTVKADMADKPVNYVSYLDSMRFVNWMENGQGSGSTESGAYAILDGMSENQRNFVSLLYPHRKRMV